MEEFIAIHKSELLKVVKEVLNIVAALLIYLYLSTTL
jgi:hypothetical protein